MSVVIESKPRSKPAGSEDKQLHWKRGICGICPAGCWVELGMRGERMVDIRPDESHQLGMICRRGQHAAEITYSEHRLKHPLRRIGAKGSAKFERITWDDAYEIIVEQLQRIKAELGPEAVSIYTGRGAFELSLCDMFQPADVAVSSASNVLFPFGSPNTMGVGALCYVSFAMIAPHVTMGRMLINMFSDIENAELLVVWGANPATDSPPLDMHRLEAAAARGAKVVVIDPRRTETADRCNAQWIPIRPGTDGALALALLDVMINEDLYDEEFAKQWCHGFDELRTYVQHFSPSVVSQITGVAAETIVDLARRIVRASGACPIMYTGLEYSNSGIQAIRAVQTVFALAGQLDVPGGMGLAMLGSHFPINHAANLPNPDIDRAVARDRFPIYSHYRGESHASGLVDAVLRGEPYSIRALIVHGASLLTSWPQSAVWRETLSKLDFLVCIDRQMTADAAYADVVLPATTMFEIDSYMVYGPIFRLREKMIQPVGEARNDYLIMAELAKRLGYGDSYPQTEEELLRHVLKGSGYTLEDVRAQGGTVRIPAPVMEYRKWEKGELRADGKPGFETPTGKFEIWSTVLEDFGYEPLPKYVEPKEGPLGKPDLAADYPLVFNSGARPHTDFRSQHHGIAGLVKDNPEPTVELNVQDAADRGIESGDLVEVCTQRGKVRFRARVTDAIVQGAIECNQGGGTPVGPKAWQESNVNELTDLSNYDEISGFPVYKALLAEVTKVEDGNIQSRQQVARKITGCHKRAPTIETRETKPPRFIYLDNAATTELDESVRDEMDGHTASRFGNPSSIHAHGRDAKDAIEGARRRVARLLGVRPRRVRFTGGGSEANNLAIKGVVFANESPRKHTVVSAIEHPSTLASHRFLEQLGYNVTILGVDRDGLVDPDELRRVVSEETLLVSVMLANNEVGTIQPVAELADIVHERGALFHGDAVQAVGKINVSVEDLHVDMLTLSGHKLHGPKGVGAICIREGLQLTPLIHGGKQEGGLRAGTENVAAVVGLGKAAELATQRLSRFDGVRALRDRLEEGVCKLIPDAHLNGHPDLRLPHVVNLTIPKFRGESVVMAMDRYGVALSSGSACKAGSPDPTHVLMAMGRTEEQAHCSIRFSLSHRTTKQDIDDTVTRLGHVLKEMETAIRFLPCK